VGLIQFDRDLVLREKDVLERVLNTYLLDFLDESLGPIKEKTYIRAWITAPCGRG